MVITFHSNCCLCTISPGLILLTPQQFALLLHLHTDLILHKTLYNIV